MSSDPFPRARVAAALQASLLEPETSHGDVRHACAAALVHGIRGVTVPVDLIGVASAELAGAGLEISARLPRADDVSRQVTDAVDAGAYEVQVPWVGGAGLTALVRAAGDDTSAWVVLDPRTLPGGGLEDALDRCAQGEVDGIVLTVTGPVPATAALVQRCRDVVGRSLAIQAEAAAASWEDVVALLDAGADVIAVEAFVAVLEAAPR